MNRLCLGTFATDFSLMSSFLAASLYASKFFGFSLVYRIGSVLFRTILPSYSSPVDLCFDSTSTESSISLSLHKPITSSNH